MCGTISSPGTVENETSIYSNDICKHDFHFDNKYGVLSELLLIQFFLGPMWRNTHRSRSVEAWEPELTVDLARQVKKSTSAVFWVPYNNH